jgi:hypothetical protein
MTREHRDRLAVQAREIASRLEHMADRASILGEAPDELHRPDSDPQNRLRDAAITLRRWALRLVPASPEGSKMIAADQLDQPEPLATHIDVVCDRLEACWERWDVGNAVPYGVQWCAATDALASAQGLIGDLADAYDPQWVAAICNLLKQARESVQDDSGQPSAAEDFASGIAHAREAAEQLRTMAAQVQ